jgi:hypothetical protein
MKRHPVLILAPKAASTSLRVLLKTKVPRIGEETRHIHLKLAHSFYQKQIENHPECWIFGTVRHPLDRFISAWAYFRTPCIRTIPENYVLEAVLQEGGVNDFVRCVSLEKISKYVPHFSPQFEFFLPGRTGRKPDQLLRFEQFRKDFKELCGNLGIEEPELIHKRSSKHDSWENLLTVSSVDKLHKYYAEDFATFDYE